MNVLRSLLGSLIAVSLILNYPVARARTQFPVYHPPKRPSLVEMSEKGKTLREAVVGVKSTLASDQFLFFMDKIKGYENTKLPKITQPAQDSYVITYDGTVVRLKILSLDKQLYSVNGKTLDLDGRSLQEQAELIQQAISDGQKHAGLWDFVIPKAHAVIPIIIAVCTILTLLLTAVANIAHSIDVACDRITTAGETCFDLSEKIRVKINQTNNLLNAQKKFEEKNDKKSAEIANKNSSSCDELQAKVAEIKKVTLAAGSALNTRWKFDCPDEESALVECKNTIKSQDATLDGVIKSACSAEATTAESPGKVSPEAVAAKVESIKEALEKTSPEKSDPAKTAKPAQPVAPPRGLGSPLNYTPINR